MTTLQMITSLRAMILAGLEEQIGDRVYLSAAAVSAQLPLCVISMETDTPEPYLTEDRRAVRFAIHLHAALEEGPAALAPLSDVLYEALHRQMLPGSGPTGPELACLDRGRVTPGRRSYYMTSRWKLGADE